MAWKAKSPSSPAVARRGTGLATAGPQPSCWPGPGPVSLVVDRELALAQRTVEMIEAEGGEAAAHAADLTDEAQCQAVVAAAVERFGRLDVLDNNVGIISKGSVVEESQAAWARVMQVNVEAMFLTSKYAIPAMIESGDGGAIVNISSISALRPRGLTAYSASKGAVIALTRAMAVDHGKDGIRVNCIAPGVVYTPMVIAGGMSPEAREMRRKSSLLEIEGEGWDIGHAVVYLCSDWSRYVTGQSLVGRRRRHPDRPAAKFRNGGSPGRSLSQVTRFIPVQAASGRFRPDHPAFRCLAAIVRREPRAAGRCRERSISTFGTLIASQEQIIPFKENKSRFTRLNWITR